MIWRGVQQIQGICVDLAGLPPLYSRGFITTAIAKRFCQGIFTRGLQKLETYH